eukprot:gb/GFBE01033783.1/.p1 GENE.gb/GFBE01033783.1/~~gb/GFBE01033783.1/.p1  ORF type:complete len:222 (+),score=42.00 gb/GFBE01033783.1/:1-666(+)
MLNSKEPELLSYGRYLDRLGTNRKAPAWTISHNENNLADKVRTTAAQHLQPGQYKLDRDFVIDKTAEVRKGKLTDSMSAPQIGFGSESRVKKSTGVMKGMYRPMNAYISPLGPGQYEAVDSLTHHHRASYPSSFAWSVPKGEAAESIREKKLQGLSPGPGIYNLPSFFDDVDKQKQEALEGKRRPSGKTQWKNQWGTMFRSIHASATSGAQTQKSRMAVTH